MNKREREAAIRAYFNMWVTRDFTGLCGIFATDIYYSECYGPEYYGMGEIYQWIDHMLAKQTVLEWHVKQFLHSGSFVVVEWYFKERQGDAEHGFDGVSMIEFNCGGKIAAIKEYESKAEHTAPYHK